MGESYDLGYMNLLGNSVEPFAVDIINGPRFSNSYEDTVGMKPTEDTEAR